MNVSREDVRNYVASRPWTEHGKESEAPKNLAEDLNEFLDWNEANGGKVDAPATIENIKKYIESSRKVVAAYDAHESAVELMRRNIDDKFIEDAMRQNGNLTVWWTG